MKQFILLIFLFIFTAVHGQITLIPDMDFEQSLISQGIDTDGLINGQVLTADISDETTLNVFKEGIFSLEGIQDFTALEFLDCSANFISELDVSNLHLLRDLICSDNDLSILDVSNLVQLEELRCTQNQISNLDVSNNTQLISLSIGNSSFDTWPKNDISSIDLSNNINLELLSCADLMSLGSLDLSANTQLRVLFASYCNLDDLDVSNNLLLQRLYLGYPLTYEIPSNNITSLDLSQNSHLFRLWAPYTTISSLNLNNGANSILNQVELRANDDLFCVEVDDPVGANNGDTPYSNWETDPQVYYQHDCSLGVDEYNQAEIILLPNPIKNSFAVSATNDIVERVVLYSLQGTQIKEVNSIFDAIDISAMQAGLYLCVIHTDQGIFIERILKE